MRLNIFSPDRILYQNGFISIILPTITGEISVLQNHAPLIVPLKEGKIRVKDEREKEFFFEIERGILEVNPKEVNILVTPKKFKRNPKSKFQKASERE